MEQYTKCLIIGSGPAGYTSAIYAGRAGISPVLYEGMEPGGQLTTTTEIENYPGFENGIDANMLMASMKGQAARFGADIRPGRIAGVDFSERPFTLEDESGNVIKAETVIIATGASAKYLGLPAEERPQGIWDCLPRTGSRVWECPHAPPVTGFSTGRRPLPSSEVETLPARRPPISPIFARKSI